jgi:hypothetical protein
MDSLHKRTKQQNTNTRFGLWNVRSFHRAGSLMTSFEWTSQIWFRFSASAGGQMGGQWYRTCRRIHIFLRKGEWEACIRYRFFVHTRIISAVKRVEFVTDRMSYIILRCCSCHIVVLNVQTLTGDKMWRTAPTRNWNVFSINSPKYHQCQSRQGRHF